ncbi:restriction endonuclease subunit S [Achromobacter xylosoxidans]|uniref:restriction endonuclease subunit S n=1 Tax=Alcaligenes xylosoxydans xylosoxydans TaxID=85698 RepID=UPI001F45A103|nr:restriction endonuclease subunit S [Achromobacter xylosoxidans]
MSLKTESLASMCEAIIDCPHSTPVWTKCGYVVLRNQNIKDGRLDLSEPSFTDDEHFKQRIRRMAPRPGDIVITREAPMGEVCKIPEGLTCCLGQRQVLLRPKADVDADYLLYALQSPFVQNQIRWNEGTGSTVSNIRIPVLEKIEIPRHDQAETNIAKALGSLDSKIDLNRRINQTLEAMAQAIFKSWFVDFDPVKAKIAAIEQGQDPLRAAMRVISGKTDAELDQMPREHHDQLVATAALFPDAMQDSELGEIPKEWEAKRVGDLIELAYGKALKSNDRKQGSVPVYGSGGVTGYHNEALVPHGAIIVGRKGTVGSLYWEDEPFFPIDTTFYVKPKVLPMTYCFYAMQTLGLDKMNTDAAVPGLNRENVYRLELVKPSIPILNAFDGLIDQTRKAMRANIIASQSLAELRDSLLPKLLSGELAIDKIAGLADTTGAI